MSVESHESLHDHPEHYGVPRIHNTKDLLRLALGAMGVVYGDIGTSPLYALKECFNGAHGIPVGVENVLGVLSMVFWSLGLVVVIKYLTFVMRADNHGEGGIMALLALLIERPGPAEEPSKRRKALVMLALFGASLLWADGMITPAISVLSAVEGLEVATEHVFSPIVVPLTVLILVGLFISQKRGTAKVAAIFGPMTLLWFFTIGSLGVYWLFKRPEVLVAANPYYAVSFFFNHSWQAFWLLGSVVLAITGAEALYADMGHFGPRPIRFAWYTVVFPALLLSYFGQGALLLELGDAVRPNPFYGQVAGTWGLYPLVVVATAATVIASQALISGAFSLAQQSVQLGYSPRLTIVHTSSEAQGQIYIPEVNRLLLVACIFLVVWFKESSNLAAAYGIAVMATMFITSILMGAVMVRAWNWSWTKAGILIALFLCVELPFLFSNATKIVHGGWFPLAIGIFIFSVMTTWKRGRRELGDAMRKRFVPIEKFIQDLPESDVIRIKGTAVFMTGNRGMVPPVLIHHVKHNKVLHEQVILLSVVTDGVPEVKKSDRMEMRDLGHGLYELTLHYGFMQTPNVPQCLRQCRKKQLFIDPEETTYYLGRETLLTSGSSRMWHWRKAIFAFLSRNAVSATAFFGIPPSRVVELGSQIQL